jgi:hypothetical protein
MRRSWRWSLLVALLAGSVAHGALGAASAQAHAGPVPPVVVVPVMPVELGLPAVLPALVGTTERHRDGMIWSTRGRADVDVDIDRQHGRAVVP